MANTLNDLIERFNSLQESFIQSQINAIPTTERADMASSKIPQIDQNTKEILDTQEGLTQTYEENLSNQEDVLTTQEGLAETYEETYTSITQCEEAIAELYEMIIN